VPKRRQPLAPVNEVRDLQAFLRTSAQRGRLAVRSAPFTVTIDERDALRYVNYAIPDDGAEPDAGAVEALRAVFRGHRRLPRLEWVEEAAPAVAAALEAQGMVEELRTPLMACTPDGLTGAPAASEGVRVAAVGDDDLHAAADVQRVAFGMGPVPDDEAPPDPRRRGGGAVLARVDGVPAAAATWTPVVDGASEVGGVATAERFRRRGLAGVVTAAAARAAFAAGARLCVLSPGGDEAQRVYARAGFRGAATMLHWSDPE
jgi:ribosomal protein S18 acetylase RimI-like enzyme